MLILHQDDDYVDISQIGKAVKKIDGQIIRLAKKRRAKGKKWKREKGRKERIGTTLSHPFLFFVMHVCLIVCK